MRKFWKRRRSMTPRMPASKFCELVDVMVEIYRLDPDLPEIAELKNQAEEIVTLPAPRPHYFLAKLDPNQYITDFEGIKVLEERMFGHVLHSWSLARHHCRRLDEDLVRICVDGQGAHLFVSHMREHEVFRVRGAAINPVRLSDPGNRYEVACELIRQFTGVEIDWREQVGTTRTINVTKSLDGTWGVEFERVKITSS